MEMETFLKTFALMLLVFALVRGVKGFKNKKNKRLNPIIDIFIWLFILTINIRLENKFEVVLSLLCIAMISICELMMRGEG